MKSVYKVLLLLSLTGTYALQAQSVKQDIEKINKAYEKAGIVSFNTLYQVFETYDAPAAYQSTTGKVKVNGHQTYHKIGNLEVISNPDYTFSVDHDMKMMVIMNRYNTTTDPTKQAKPDLNALLKECSSITYSEPRKGFGAYEMACPSESFSKVKVTFDKRTYLLESITMYYAEEQTYGEDASRKSRVKIQISYSGYQSNEAYSDEYFTYSKYLTKTGNYKYSVKSPYMKYQFLNNIKNN